MTFDYNAYEKVFPHVTQPEIATDSAVDGYNPTADEANGKAASNDAKAIDGAQNVPENTAQPPKMDANPINGANVQPMGKTATTGEINPLEGALPTDGGKD